MSSEHFSVRFVGSSVERHEIDVRDLAPALLALGDLFQASSRKLNGDRVKTSVMVRASAPGSFEVDLGISQSLRDTVVDFLDFAGKHQEDVVAASELVDLILKVGGGAAAVAGGTVGLIALLKKLRGARPERRETEKDGRVTLIIGDTKITTDARVVALAEDLHVREAAQKLAASVAGAGIERVEFRGEASAETAEAMTEISAEDIPAFGIPDIDDEVLEKTTAKKTLQLISISFKDGNKWRFTDGGDEFFAEIEDVDFLNRVARDEVSFSKSDYLTCMVREVQTVGIKGLRRERVIERVLDHTSAARQLKLI